MLRVDTAPTMPHMGFLLPGECNGAMVGREMQNFRLIFFLFLKLNFNQSMHEFFIKILNNMEQITLDAVD
jgi:hypothetical protein